MKTNAFKLLAGVVVLALALTACGAAATAAPTAVPAPKGKVCEVTDTGGVDDKGFNQIGWEGAQASAKTLGWDAVYLESKQQTDYDKNITEFINSKCDLIVTVGFLLGDATKASAEAHTDQKFQILDYAYSPDIPNVWGQVYATNEASFLAGYLAAGMSKSGKVGTFGGINIPPVADFMVGFQEGIEYYNKQKGTSVALIGWDNANKAGGTFVGNFTSKDDGKNTANAQMDEGADIIFPVAGPVGLGSAAAIQQRGAGYYMIGVDTDQFVSTEFGAIMLSSVLKHLELSVQEAAKAAADGSFKGGTHVANLANGGVGLAPFHNFDAQVPQSLKDELKQVAQDIIDGKIKVDSFATLK